MSSNESDKSHLMFKFVDSIRQLQEILSISFDKMMRTDGKWFLYVCLKQISSALKISLQSDLLIEEYDNVKKTVFKLKSIS